MNKMTELLRIMERLRDPVSGCPWDRKQTITTISPYTLEEVYELVETIEQNDLEGLRDELGDLLFHIVFYAQMAKEADGFCFEDVLTNVINKLTRRHPHVFADSECANAEDLQQLWESIKQQERRDKNTNRAEELHYLDGISQAQPAVSRAYKLQKRAAAVGFDWNDPVAVIDKIDEELAELKYEIKNERNQERLQDEIGDLLFAVINCARHLNIEPEQALRGTNRKFEHRFGYLEDRLKEQGKDLAEAGLDEMEQLWQQAKIHKHEL